MIGDLRLGIAIGGLIHWAIVIARGALHIDDPQ
jgi:hypothetical protein